MPKKALTITLAILGLAGYIALSFWVVGLIRQGKLTVPFLQNQGAAATTTALPQTNFSNVTQTTQPSTPTPTLRLTPTPRPTPTPMPTPTSVSGSGRYACDADGICGDFSDQARANCSKTFADPSCLGMCGTPSVRCSQ